MKLPLSCSVTSALQLSLWGQERKETLLVDAICAEQTTSSRCTPKWKVLLKSVLASERVGRLGWYMLLSAWSFCDTEISLSCHSKYSWHSGTFLVFPANQLIWLNLNLYLVLQLSIEVISLILMHLCKTLVLKILYQKCWQHFTWRGVHKTNMTPSYACLWQLSLSVFRSIMTL